MTALVRRYDEKSEPRQLKAGVKRDIDRDIDVIVWSMGLHNIRRYFHQRFWEEETRASEFATRVEPLPRLESVSDHSWHIAFICNLLAPRHENLDQAKVLQLAVLHDILEIIVGDQSPIGRDGTGRSTHAFNERIAQQRSAAEETALASYINRLPADAAEQQRLLLDEYRRARSQEAKFVKCIDKMQTLAFVLIKKSGDMEDKHIRFTLNYSEKGISYFPALEDHFRNLQARILESVAELRQMTVADLRMQLFGTQLSFW
jgi:5'-deoxynucleotidase YfbR-like HD superfamily hydrolase